MAADLKGIVPVGDLVGRGITVLDSKKVTDEEIAAYKAELWSDAGAKLRRWLAVDCGLPSHTIDIARLGRKQAGEITYLMIPYVVGLDAANIAAVSVFGSTVPRRIYASKTLVPYDASGEVLLTDDEHRLVPESVEVHGAALGEVLVVPDELDAILTWVTARKHAVALPVPPDQALRPDWIRHFKGFERITFVMTPEVARMRATYERARQLGFERVRVALLPEGTTSIREVVKTAGHEAFVDLLSITDEVKLPSVSSIADTIGEMEQALLFPDEAREKGLATSSFQNVDRILKPIMPGHLLGVIALPKVGKTTYALQMFMRAADAGTPGLFCCGEMTKEDLVTMLIQARLGVAAPITDAAVLAKAKRVLGNLPLYIADADAMARYSHENLPELLALIREVIHRYAVRLVGIDHLHTLVRGARFPEVATGTVTQSLKRFSVAERIATVLLIQPTKVGDDRDVDIADGKYTGFIAADVDRWIALNRRKVKDAEMDEEGNVEALLSPLTKLTIGGRGTTGGTAYLMLEGELARFRRLEPDEVVDIRSTAERAAASPEGRQRGNGGRNQRG